MKKKTAGVLAIALIILNLFLSPTRVEKNQSRLSLSLLEARADEPGETDPSNPGEKYPPMRSVPSDSTSFLIYGSIF